jgi:hypothetical protein
MADLTITIPDPQIPRIIAAITPFIEEGDAVDIENPTGAEASAKLESYLRIYIENFVRNQERKIHQESFEFTDLGLT